MLSQEGWMAFVQPLHAHLWCRTCNVHCTCTEEQAVQLAAPSLPCLFLIVKFTAAPLLAQTSVFYSPATHIHRT